MKKLKIVSLAAMIVCIASLVGAASYSLLDGRTSTNLNVKYNAPITGTNSSGVITNNFQLGTVPGSSNIMWQLSASQGSQPFNGTNGFLPSAGITAIGYPGTLYGPFNNLSITTQAALVATNASSTTITFRFAGSNDGNLWLTNYFVQSYVIPINSTTPVIPVAITNITLGGLPYFALQEIDNPGASAVTNIVIQATGKTGL
ncbi:MAG: hypothetical protein KGL39_21675 [Patescibacteria group bacterium]|nr:hypothetical protein [Patescibacteria group bacterium]